MDTALAKQPVLVRGTLTFSIESRLLRELGERLVKQPEVAIVELIKNAYDADASECTVEYDPQNTIVVADDGIGMTLDRFTDGWMRVGTSSKKGISVTENFSRLITGEKGIGRFAVRFLGRGLHLESVADDPARGIRNQADSRVRLAEIRPAGRSGEVARALRTLRSRPNNSDRHKACHHAASFRSRSTEPECDTDKFHWHVNAFTVAFPRGRRWRRRQSQKTAHPILDSFLMFVPKIWTTTPAMSRRRFSMRSCSGRG